jgi:hypothetical protein
MTNPIIPCCLYFLYALAYVIFTTLLQVDVASDMFRSINRRFEVVPYSQNPDLTLKDVHGGPDVYKWMTSVFLPQLYAEDAQNNLEDGYCTEKYPCLLGEGNANSDNQCARHLRKGVANCPAYMGGGDCCEPCLGLGSANATNGTCNNITIDLRGTKITETTKVTKLSENCEDDMPSWLPLLGLWPGSYNPENASVQNSSDFKFCPERVARLPQDPATPAPVAARALKVAAFNQVIAGRITMKRIKLDSSSSADFKAAYPRFPNVGRTSAAEPSPGDSRDTFGKDEDNQYAYDKDGGYKGAGGYVHFLDFNKSQRAIRSEINQLNENYWFDLYQGSFVIEMLFFNGNYELFMHISWVFEHDFAGSSHVYVQCQPLNMSFQNSDTGFSYYLRYFCLASMILLMFWFLRTEVDDMSADPKVYFTGLQQILQLCSLALSFTVVIMWALLVFNYDYRQQKLPLLEDSAEKLQQFDNLVSLANLASAFQDVMSVNLCLIIIRCIFLMANMTPSLSVIVSTLHRAGSDLFAFITVFSVLFLGCTFASYFLCGSRNEQYKDFIYSVITCLKMVMGESQFSALASGDPVLGMVFFFFFHMSFIIVQNVLLSVLCLAYNEERKRVENPAVAEKYPLKHTIKELRTKAREGARKLTQCIAACWTFLFQSQGSGAIRVNYDEVNKFRDKRSSYKPKFRAVQYESKGQDDISMDVRKPKQDLKLRATEPIYPEGRMNYYVQEVKQEGQAGEVGVRENWRLVSIQQQGEADPKAFRDMGKFYDKQEYDKDPQKIFEKFDDDHPPITLEFEGWVDPISEQCLFNLMFVIILSLFSAYCLRITDVFYLTEVQKMNTIRPSWYDYNPRRLVNMTEMEGLVEVPKYFNTAFNHLQYSCITSAVAPGECQDAALKLVRPTHSLYAGPNGTLISGPPLGMGFTPTSAQGLSLGFLPFSQVRGGDPTWSTDMVTVPRILDWNVGFMPNNFIRATIQVTCFRKNPAEKWRFGYPYILHRLAKGGSCAHEACMAKQIEDIAKGKEVCLDSNGVIRDPKIHMGPYSKVNYFYTKKGTYEDMGGIAIGFGGTMEEAAMVQNVLHQDQLLTGTFVNSLVSEFVQYNENFDLFVYTKISFSLLATGKLQKEFDAIVFPLNTFSQGKQSKREGLRTAVFVFWVLVLLCVLRFVILFLMDLLNEYRICAELQKPPLYFINSFFSESWWNLWDFVGVILVVVVQYFFFRYLMIGQRIQDWGWSSWTTKKFKFENAVHESRGDDFSDFSLAAWYYKHYTMFVGFSILFVSVRNIKYMVAIPQLRLVVMTLATAVWELLAILWVLFLALLAFAFMFLVRFGPRFERWGSVLKALFELFFYMCGVFKTDDLLHAGPYFFLIVFPLVQIIFYFILANMFLATIVYKWKDVRKDAQTSFLSSVKAAYPRWCRMRDSGAKDPSASGSEVPLNGAFWRECAVLNYLTRFDDFGNITGFDRKSQGKDAHDDGDQLATQASQNGTRDLEKTFKKAHMEIASLMCRSINPDVGAGAIHFLTDGQQVAILEDEGDNVVVGIMEDPVEIGTSKKIKQDLEDKLKPDEHHGPAEVAQEIWLDALVTVLEGVGALDEVQKFFLPPPMIKPKSMQEWQSFDQKKVKMQKRLDVFLKLLKEATHTAHYKYLKDSAKTKEKVMKQQSLVLADYLDQLEDRINKLQQEIKVLERKNAQMRSHVSPLL